MCSLDFLPGLLQEFLPAAGQGVPGPAGAAGGGGDCPPTAPHVQPKPGEQIISEGGSASIAILIASRTSILGFNSTNIRRPSPV